MKNVCQYSILIKYNNKKIKIIGILNDTIQVKGGSRHKKGTNSGRVTNNVLQRVQCVPFTWCS